MKDKQGKNDDGYTIIFLLITVLVLYASCLVVLSKATEWKDIYAAGCSIVGGIVGGLLTLQGVKQTIYAQRKITLETIEEQRKQDALKLIPQKLVALHNLTTEIESFTSEVTKMTVLSSYSLFLKAIKLSGIEEYRDYMNKKVNKIEEFYKNLNNKEYKLIEVVSQVDVDTYKTVKVVFKRIKQECEWFLASSEIRDYYEKVYYAKATEGEELVKIADRLILKLTEFKVLIENILKELESVIPEKLQEYEKEML